MRVVVESFDKKSDRLKPKIKKTASKLARLLKIENAYLEIYLVGDDFMKTNVLAFPAPKDFPRPDIRNRSLGEIYLNPNFIAKNQLPHILIHGFLHLLGYDHKKKNDRIKMEQKEKQIWRKITLSA